MSRILKLKLLLALLAVFFILPGRNIIAHASELEVPVADSAGGEETADEEDLLGTDGLFDPELYEIYVDEQGQVYYIEKEPAAPEIGDATGNIPDSAENDEPAEEAQEVDKKEADKPSYTEDDLRLLACLVYAEAGNQPYEGMLAVANVVLNRVKSSVYSHVNTIEEVIYDRKWAVQFSVTIKNSKTGKSMLDKALEAYDTGVFTGKNPEAEKKAMQDAGIAPEQLDAAWFSTHMDDVGTGRGGTPMGIALRLPNIGVTRVENFCAGGDFRWQHLPVPFEVYSDGIDLPVFEEFGSGAAALDLSNRLEKQAALLQDETYRRRFRKDYDSKFGLRVWHRDFFDAEIVPVTIAQKKGDPIIVSQDEHPRATSLESLAKLKGVVRPDGTVTAGNASGVNDGACALLLANEAAARQYGLTPRARVVGMATAGLAPRIMGFGPAPATRKVLALTGLTLAQMDVIELNEAFAAQGLAVLRDLGLADDDARVNPNGGAIALGHPLGASGARLVTTAINQLHRTGGRYALCTMCIGVGQGIAIVVERV